MCMKKKNSNEIICVSIIILILAMISIVLYSFSEGINGNDFWWHIKIGEWIVKNKAVPTTDIFSWYGVANNFEWTAHEWLADIIFYLIYSTFGEEGMYIFSLTLAYVMMFLMFGKCKKYIEINYLIGGLFFALYAITTSFFFYGRPHVFSYLLLYFELDFLYDFQNNPKSKKIYFIPVLAVLWSNLHGGSANLSYIVCFIFLVANLFNFNIGRVKSVRFEKKELRKLVVILIVTIFCILINPIGMRVLSYPYINMSDTVSMSYIYEWQAPDAKLFSDLIFCFLPIAIMSIGIFCEKKEIAFIDVLIMLVFLFLFFRSIRFIMLWYVAAVFYAFKYVPFMKIKDITKSSERIVLRAVIGFLLISIGINVVEIYNTYREEGLISRVISDEIVEIVKQDSPNRIFNDYNLGEALIYNDIPVFFDSRADLYSQDNLLSDGISFMRLEKINEMEQNAYVEVDELIEKYQFDAILILQIRPLYAYIISHPEKFEKVYEDETIGYFKIISK